MVTSNLFISINKCVGLRGYHLSCLEGVRIDKVRSKVQKRDTLATKTKVKNTIQINVFTLFGDPFIVVFIVN